MKFTSIALGLAAAGVAAAEIHGHHVHARHAHAHHRRDVKDVVYEFVLENGDSIGAAKACELIEKNVLKNADGMLPAGACPPPSAASSSSTSTAEPSSTTQAATQAVNKAAELLAQSASISTMDSSTSTSTPTPTPSPVSTSSTESVPTSTSTSTPEPTSTSTSSVVSSSSSSSSTSATTPTVSMPGGGVVIRNNSPHTIYMWIFDSPAAPPMQTLASGQELPHEWRTNPDGGGVSVKVSTVPDISNVVQYEYTVAGDMIFYDLSLINMNLLQIVGNLLPALGFSVTSPGTSCVPVVCEAGIIQCPAAYLFPADNHATHGCPINSNMIFNIGL